VDLDLDVGIYLVPAWSLDGIVSCTKSRWRFMASTICWWKLSNDVNPGVGR
jgi:hypothetical protein